MVIGFAPVAFGQVVETNENHNIIDLGNGTFQFQSHNPYFQLENGEWQPYRLIDDVTFIQAEFSDAKYVWDKTNGGMTVYVNGSQVIQSDTYLVRGAELNTDNWFFLQVNDAPVDVFVSETGEEEIIITARRQNAEGVFDVEYKVNSIENKATAKFENQQFENHKFAVTQTLNLADPIIKLNSQEIDLRNFEGQTFPREILEANNDLVIEASELYYNSGLGFENLWSVGIFDNNRIALDYANVNQTKTAIGEIYELDPTFGFNSPNNTIDIANGGSSCSGTHFYCVFDWDTSSIPTGSTVTDVQLKAKSQFGCCNTSHANQSWSVQVKQTTKNASGTNFDGSFAFGNLPSYTSIQMGPANVWRQVDLGTNADTQAQQNLSSFYSVGLKGATYGGSVFYGYTQIQITYTVPPPPDPATNLTVSQTTANQLELSWTAPTTGATPIGYKIERSPDNATWSTLTADTGNTNTTYSDGSLSLNTTYYYRVSSFANNQYATPTNVASATTWNVPNQVSGVSGQTGIPIILTWTQPTSDDTITNYKIYRDGSLLTTVGNVLTYSDNSVVGSTIYNYQISAVSPVGEGQQSSGVNVLAGVPPDAPTGLTTTIQDANANPLDIYLQWSSPTNVGSGTLTGFEIWRDGALITTTGLVTTYTDTVSSSGTYSYQVKAVSTHGTSGFSNSSNQTTPTVPNAITDLSATVDSDTQISLSWSAPNNGGSNIINYKVFQDGVQIATPTSANYVVTGLTSNTQYTFKVIAVNNVGDSADSNLVTPTTYQGVTGSINVSSTIQGATAKLTFTQNVTSGTPTPNFNTFTLKEGTTTIASNISSPYYLAIPDGASHSYTITSTDNTHWNTPTISGSANNIVATYNPNWSSGVAYNYTRANNIFDLNVNQDSQALWDLNCEYKTGGQILAKSGGINATFSNVWYVSDSQTILDTETVYIECTDASGIVVSITSYGPSRIGGGIALLDNFFEDWTGTPVALFFVLLVAGLFSGRTAPTGILLMLSIVGVMGFVGLLVIDELIWSFVLLTGVLGMFVGKRFL
jgi:hypothetical protein